MVLSPERKRRVKLLLTSLQLVQGLMQKMPSMLAAFFMSIFKLQLLKKPFSPLAMKE